MSSNDESHPVSHFSRVLSSDESPNREDESLEGPSEDVSLVEEHLDEGASIKRGGSREGGGGSVGDEPQAEEEVLAS